MKNVGLLAGPMRVPFLILTPACLFLGYATAAWRSSEICSGEISGLYFLLVLAGAVAAHISVNAFNEYLDFKSGLDEKTERTPFSGGSGTLPENPRLAPYALWIALLMLLITGLVGLFFLIVWGLGLLPLGLVGIFLIVAYTRWITSNPFLCLLAPGLGFGPLMVMGTDFILTGHYSLAALTASLVPFFLVNNLLLLNQFPDVEADRSVGRRTLPVVIGKKPASLVYILLLVLTYGTIIGAVVAGILPKGCLLGLLTAVLAIPVFAGVYRDAEDADRLLGHMRLNVIINIVTPILVGAGLLIAG